MLVVGRLVGSNRVCNYRSNFDYPARVNWRKGVWGMLARMGVVVWYISVYLLDEVA